METDRQSTGGGEPPVFSRLKQLLEAAGASFSVSRHAPVFTSQEAAIVRGTPLASGAKALVCLADGRPVMFVMPADLRLATKAAKKALGVRDLRFANKEQVHELTGLAPGAIPPFGSLFGLSTYCDSRMAEHCSINFNAGDHSLSISLSFDDYARVETPSMGEFGESTPG
jgi:prolyl-tRNA editing enzyme YbaK/EbsC (Cys-tRNA(Pro) deacylase)